jgi:hypothetical protein
VYNFFANNNMCDAQGPAGFTFRWWRERSDIPLSLGQKGGSQAEAGCELTQTRERQEFEIQIKAPQNYLLFFPSPSMTYTDPFCRALRLSNLLIKLLNY